MGHVIVLLIQYIYIYIYKLSLFFKCNSMLVLPLLFQLIVISVSDKLIVDGKNKVDEMLVGVLLMNHSPCYN